MRAYLLFGVFIFNNMKILGISGSPRRDGNTDHAVRTALEIIDEKMQDAEVEFIRIAEYQIEQCKGCRYCMTHVECIIKDDDLNLFIGKMHDSDLIILGAPIYWYGPPGVFKDFIDRTHAFYPDKKRFIGKRVAVISVAADGGFPSHEKIMSWLESYGAKYVGSVRLYAREKNELQQKPKQLEKLKGFAEKLATIV
jgi:multimeric flavodoxin WrbA